MATGFGGFDQGRLHGHVNQIADQGRAGQIVQHQVQGRLVIHALVGGVDQHGRPGQGGMAIGPIVHFHHRGVERSQCMGFVAGAVEQANFKRTGIDQGNDDRTCSAASTQQGDGTRISAPIGFVVPDALQITIAVVVVAMQAAIGLHHDAVDGTHALGHGGQVVHQRHRLDLVRQGDVATRQPQCR